MTTSRLAILLATLLAGMSTVFLLPRDQIVQPVGIDMNLPKMVGGKWFGRDVEISDREIGGLGRETEFSRKLYTNARGDEILASIVLAGHDMNTSIHRPEWCLPAQGWTIAGSSKIAVAVPGRGTLRTTRLSNARAARDTEGKPVAGADGQSFMVRNLDYYWFVGYDTVTDSHFMRNLIDTTDRLTKGYNQRWAFVTVAATLTDNLRPDGIGEKAADEEIKDFIAKLVPLTHKETVKF